MLQILQVDRAGSPLAWLHVKEAAQLEALGKIAWGVGAPCVVLRGGTSARTGLISLLPIRPVISLMGEEFRPLGHKAPAVSRLAVLRRDRHICAYCGECYREADLTVDHVLPKSRNGPYSWQNLVASCVPCNQRKNCWTPEEARMPLLYLPYVPSTQELFILRNRAILADQMDYLRAGLPKASRLHA